MVAKVKEPSQDFLGACFTNLLRKIVIEDTVSEIKKGDKPCNLGSLV